MLWKIREEQKDVETDGIVKYYVEYRSIILQPDAAYKKLGVGT